MKNVTAIILFSLFIPLFSSPQALSRPLEQAEALDILGLDINFTQADLKNAYRVLSKQNHPDTNQGLPPDEIKRKEETLYRIIEAHRLLSTSKLAQTPPDPYGPYRAIIEEFRLKDLFGNLFDIERIRYLAEYNESLLGQSSLDKVVDFHLENVDKTNPFYTDLRDQMAIAAIIKKAGQNFEDLDRAMLKLLMGRRNLKMYNLWILNDNINAIAFNHLPRSTKFLLARELYEKEFGETYQQRLDLNSLLIRLWMKKNFDSRQWTILVPYLSIRSDLASSFFWTAFSITEERREVRLRGADIDFIMKALAAVSDDFYGAVSFAIFMSSRWAGHPEFSHYKEDVWRYMQRLSPAKQLDIELLQSEIRHNLEYATKKQALGELAELNRLQQLLAMKLCELSLLGSE